MLVNPVNNGNAMSEILVLNYLQFLFFDQETCYFTNKRASMHCVLQSKTFGSTEFGSARI